MLRTIQELVSNCGIFQIVDRLESPTIVSFTTLSPAMTPKHFWQLVFTTTQLNLKSEASKSYLMYAWWFLEPLLFVAVFYVVFGIFMAQNKPGFVVFLLCGQVPFLWFARTISNGCSSIAHGIGLMSQIRIPKLYFPLVTIFQDTVKSLCVFALLLVFVAIYDSNITAAWFALPVIMLVQFTFVLSLTLLCAMLVPFIPDIKYLVATSIQLAMFGSGIFYDFRTVIREEHVSLYLANPLANLINQYRSVLIEGVLPDWQALATIMVISSLVVVLLIIVLKRLDSVYPRVLLE
ncbi:ABC transporter permease [Aestuariibacter halophilus]|uniref:ABC transporter permease n=1 Tax=Fluctibacter halophilus TaxID=226011 RepID=A0ABS8GA02_9ALTE|nr:ABC transporter permease [Aestuariibacter halophilus]MCC2617238.1 ABC transporter permease [Aestuariibacter halophilus]